MVTVNDDLYTEYILRGNRDYDAFLLFTNIGNRYHCTLCPYFSHSFLINSAANREFAMVAKAYSKLAEKAEHDILFIRVPIDTSTKVFQYHGITSAPILTYLSKDEVLGKKVLLVFKAIP